MQINVYKKVSWKCRKILCSENCLENFVLQKSFGKISPYTDFLTQYFEIDFLKLCQKSIFVSKMFQKSI